VQSREKYARNYVALSTGKIGRGSSLRELNDVVFDAVVGTRRGSVRVGIGAGLYGFVGKWVPGGLVAWMMGVRKVGGEPGFFGRFWGSEFGGGKGRVDYQMQRAIENGSSGESEGEGGVSPVFRGGSGMPDFQNEGLGESGYVYPQRPDGSFGNRSEA